MDRSFPVVRGWAAATIVCQVLVAACSGGGARIGDRYFLAERYVEAAAAYEQYLGEGVDNRVDRALISFRLAVIYARRGTSNYDPERSSELLGESLDLHPDSDYSLQAEVLLDQVRRLWALETQIAERRGRVETLFAEISAMQERIERAEGQAGEREKEVAALSQQIAGLRAEIDSLLDELAQRERELDRLKAIDFGSDR